MSLATIKRNIQDSIQLKKALLENESLLLDIQKVADSIIYAYKNGQKVLLCGNGGSAADAQHIAAELSGRYYLDRAPLNAEALHVNGSYLTAVANDYSFEQVYERLVQGLGRSGDILIGLSTSGTSKNVLLALEKAQKMGLKTIGFSGQTGGQMHDFCDLLISIDSTDTPRIQECHLLIGHAVCELVEQALFS